MREIIGDDSLAVGFGFPIEAVEVYSDGQSSSQDLSSSSTSGFGKCGSKTTCSEMTSCDEAIYVIEQFGVSRLDGDGTACESIGEITFDILILVTCTSSFSVGGLSGNLLISSYVCLVH